MGGVGGGVVLGGGGVLGGGVGVVLGVWVGR